MTETHEGDPRPEEIVEEHWTTSEWAGEAARYLLRLKSYLGEQEETRTSISIPVAGKRFLVSPRERELVLGFDNPQAETISEQDELIRHCIGMQVKLMADVHRYEQADRSARSNALRRLNAGIEYCDLCAYEMHRSVSNLSKNGDLEGGKLMAEYRRRLVGVLDKAGKAAGGEDKAPDIETVTRPDYDPKAALRAKARSLGKKKKKKRDISDQLSKIYTIASIFLFVLTAVILFKLWSGRERALEGINVGDLRKIPGVEEVICRPPGVIVIVSDATWNAASAGEKRNVIHFLVTVAEPMGYRRAEIRSPTRQALALWKKGEEPQIQ